MSTCMWGLAQYFHILSVGDRFFTQNEAKKLSEAGYTFLHMYSHLADLKLGSHLWHIVPKFHHFQHLLDDALTDLGNPRFFTCFGDEDTVGQILRLAKAGHALTTVESALDKHALGLRARLGQRCAAGPAQP